MKNILVFFGGQSTEHDISVLTGVMTAGSLDKEKYGVYPVYVARDGGWYYGEELFDVGWYGDIKRLPAKVTMLGGDNALYKVGRGGRRNPFARPRVS